MRHRLIAAAIALGVLACSPVAPSPSTTADAPTTVAPATTSPATSPLPTPGPAASPVTVSAEGDGLKLVGEFDRLEVEAGGVITVRLSIENTRTTDVVFDEPCAADTMTVDLRVPVEPIGRQWDGIAGAFKAYALEQSSGSPMESSIRTPQRTVAAMEPCHAATGTEPGLPPGIIPAGTTYETVLTWPAELVRGVPAIIGPAPYSIKVLYDHEAVGNGMVKADTLEADGTVTIVGGAPGAVSAGQALDATLADQAFAAWLSQQPRNAWVNANLFLQPGAIGVAALPDVPYWDVELYREPRNWAFFAVDALGGQVLKRTFCEIPCDR